MFFVVLRWIMRWIGLLFILPAMKGVNGNAVYHLPGSTVAVVGIVDKAFGIDDSIDDLSRVESQLRYPKKMRLFFFVKLQWRSLGRTVNATIIDFRQPPTCHFIEMLQGPKRTAVEKTLFHVVERAFHFAFGFWSTDLASPKTHRCDSTEMLEGRDVLTNRRFKVLTFGDADILRRLAWP